MLAGARVETFRMAEHGITFTTEAKIFVGNVDHVYVIDGDDQKFGELRISRGGFDWYGRDAKVPIKLTWEQFAARLERPQ